MNHLSDTSDEVFDRPRDREITLSATLILGIFFGLAVLCAAFFGFGYSLGNRQRTIAAVAPTAAASLSGAKPAAGSTSNSAARLPVPTPSAAASQVVDTRTDGPQANPVDKPFIETSEQAPSQSTPRPVASRPALTTATPPSTLSSSVAGPPSVVQVAAVSHQEDADLIASTLKRRGYAVVIRQEPQDKLLHVQVGPFANRKDAEAMRQRLLADGFNAYIK